MSETLRADFCNKCGRFHWEPTPECSYSQNRRATSPRELKLAAALTAIADEDLKVLGEIAGEPMEPIDMSAHNILMLVSLAARRALDEGKDGA